MNKLLVVVALLAVIGATQAHPKPHQPWKKHGHLMRTKLRALTPRSLEEGQDPQESIPRLLMRLGKTSQYAQSFTTEFLSLAAGVSEKMHEQASIFRSEFERAATLCDNTWGGEFQAEWARVLKTQGLSPLVRSPLWSRAFDPDAGPTGFLAFCGIGGACGDGGRGKGVHPVGWNLFEAVTTMIKMLVAIDGFPFSQLTEISQREYPIVKKISYKGLKYAIRRNPTDFKDFVAWSNNFANMPLRDQIPPAVNSLLMFLKLPIKSLAFENKKLRNKIFGNIDDENWYTQPYQPECALLVNEFRQRISYVVEKDGAKKEAAKRELWT